MRFLADAGISPKTIAFLRQQGHDAIHVRELDMQRASDREIVERARSEDRVVLTFDLDFGEILALGVHDRPSVVILRLSDETAQSVNAKLASVLSQEPSSLRMGSLILIEDVRYRIRKLPIGR